MVGGVINIGRDIPPHTQCMHYNVRKVMHKLYGVHGVHGTTSTWTRLITAQMNINYCFNFIVLMLRKE